MDVRVDPAPSDVVDLSLVQAWTDVLDLLPDAVFIVRGMHDRGRISYLNPRASQMFGYEHGELVNQSIQLLVPHSVRENHELHRRAYAWAPKLRTMGAGLALLGRRRDGSEFPIDVLLKPTEDSVASMTIAIVRDMTERKLLEDALRQARDSAERANEVKSRFLAAASHDLRQPLQTIWSLQAVLGRALGDTEYAAHFALLEESVRSMDQILSSLIDINRLEKGAIQPVIRDFPLQDILPRLRSEFGYAASIKSLILDIQDSPEFARSDPMLLPVILRNLIGNAIKYTQSGSVQLSIRSDVDRDQLYIDIVDTGSGIPPEHLERLFEAFYQIDNPNRDQSQGVGLGLSIVQTICRLLDHTVTIESSLGRGSTFTVQLARGLAAALAAPPAQIIGPIAAATVNRAQVLHVEDDPGVARSMAMLLRLEGYDVTSAASRDEALQHIEYRGLRPDLILCDFQLPMGFTGDQIVAEIAAKLQFKPPTIMLTGDIADKHVEKAKLIAERILPKPVDIMVLLREIEILLAPATDANLKPHQEEELCMKTTGKSDARSGPTHALVRTSESTNKTTIKSSRETAPIEAERRHALIAEAAYLLAEQRHFEAGHDVEDWLAAEIDLNRTRAAPVAGSS
jgi:two-component system, sensor histidine kinase